YHPLSHLPTCRHNMLALRQLARRPVRVQPLMRFSTSAIARSAASPAPDYKNIIVEQRDNVALIRLNRPKALNALSSELFHEVNDALKRIDDNPAIGAIVLTGSERAFAAGADIKEMRLTNYIDNYKSNFLGHWTFITQVRKPVIAA